IGQRNVIKVPSAPDNSIRIDALRDAAYAAVKAGKRIACFVATMGTTDAFGIDDLASVKKLRDELVEKCSLDYVPHIHADAVIGWAWSVFNTYDFRANPLGFRGRTVRALAAAHYRIHTLGLADSIGVDFHKTGYAPYTSSMVLVRDREEWKRIARNRALMPYLFQSGEYHPGMYSLETTRSGAGPMAALANLLLFGREGLQVLLGHVVEAAEALREAIESHPYLTVLNGENVGPVTLMRAYPDDVDTFTVKHREQHDADYTAKVLEHNDYNRRLFERINSEALAGRGVMLSLTDCYRESDAGTPISALKSYILSPFTDAEHALTVYRHLAEAREHIRNA
ncbi:MAG TPA: pyridoxal-dependent decarboxylase, partial [Pirellulales bacterium]